MANHPKAFLGKRYFLSNFYPHSYSLPMLAGPIASSEHGFNAMKTLDAKEQAWVLSAPTPGEAKRRGRSVTLRPDWDAWYRVTAMRANLEAKFAYPSLRYLLLATGHEELVEYNTWHDNFWGVCTCQRHGVSLSGANMLGTLLMELRTSLTSEKSV